jgi:hypothetical protein
MKKSNQYYTPSLLLLLMFLFFASKSDAVEVVPDIGFRQFQAANGAELDPNGGYRSPINTQGSLNDKVLPDSHLSKMVPGFNSLGLNFIFKLD